MPSNKTQSVQMTMVAFGNVKAEVLSLSVKSAGNGAGIVMKHLYGHCQYCFNVVTWFCLQGKRVLGIKQWVAQ